METVWEGPGTGKIRISGDIERIEKARRALRVEAPEVAAQRREREQAAAARCVADLAALRQSRFGPAARRPRWLA